LFQECFGLLSCLALSIKAPFQPGYIRIRHSLSCAHEIKLGLMSCFGRTIGSPDVNRLFEMIDASFDASFDQTMGEITHISIRAIDNF